MSSSGTGSVGGSLGRPLYQRKVFANPASVPDAAPTKSVAPSSVSAPTPAAVTTVSHAATQGRSQALTQKLDDKLTSQLTQIRQKIGSGFSRSGVTLDTSA